MIQIIQKRSGLALWHRQIIYDIDTQIIGAAQKL